MFENRLKVVLLVLIAVTALLALRAAQIQVLGQSHWDAQASESMKRTRTVETIRGQILDRKGRVLAKDEASVDACVDYRVITDPPDEKWVEQHARSRLTRRLGNEYKNAPYAKRKELMDAEMQLVREDISAMWETLAGVSKQSLAEIERARLDVVQRVQMRRRYIWYARWRSAVRQHEDREEAPWYKAWLLGDSETPPELDHFDEPISEEDDPHPILRDIDNETFIYLKKHAERLPGLTLRDSTHRRYPYGSAACHVLGHMGRVVREDLQNDPHLGSDSLRQYQYNDLIGRTGIEALAEPALRGARGQIVTVAGREEVAERTPPVPGQDVRTTLDIELQDEIERLFQSVKIKYEDNTEVIAPMHGAAVVLDVPTGEVLALASAPTFDLNRFEEAYHELVTDELNQPLLNRATQWAVEPGSTVKPIVGLAALSEGLFHTHDTIECTGYLVVNGKPIRAGFRCWVASLFENHPDVPSVAHHQIPSSYPHPSGWLTVGDGLERSCNVVFETLAGRLKMDGVRKWFLAFGLGRPTGIGIAERRGRIPNAKGLRSDEINRTTWFSGIGQGQVAATPLQMANVAATIARDGVWMRPRLVSRDVPTTRPAGVPKVEGPDVVDLKIPPEALAEVQSGMRRATSTGAGTGNYIRDTLQDLDLDAAGKTGTAQASPYRVPKRDAYGEPVRDENGRITWRLIEPSTQHSANPEAPWYRVFGENGRRINHAWYIAYAPADNPQIAVAAMVEYGGSGGRTAGHVVEGVLRACERHGYITAAQKP